MTTAPESPPARRPSPAEAVSLDAASRMVGVSRRTLERRVAAGELPTRRLGRRVLVRVVDLAELIEGRSGPADPPS